MIYDIRLALDYHYASATAWGHHLLRMRPLDGGPQQVSDLRIVIEPHPTEVRSGTDFFGNGRMLVLCEGPHDRFSVTLEATVAVSRPVFALDLTPPLGELVAQAAAVADISGASPAHMLAPSRLAVTDPAIAAFGAELAEGAASVFGYAEAVSNRIHETFAYKGDVTTPRTTAAEAFAGQEGVCQDFAHVMISALRSQGVPAAYVSGLLRTIPPEGEERLEGADAMHAWVDVWCGDGAGWIGFDPTNALVVANDHIVVARGRDYADVAPIDGVILTSTTQDHGIAVDVVPRT